MIRSFRSQETERLFHRQPSRKFRAIERSALRKLDMLDAALNVWNDLRILATLLGNRLNACAETARGNTEFGSTSHGGFALNGAMAPPTASKSPTITRRTGWRKN